MDIYDNEITVSQGALDNTTNNTVISFNEISTTNDNNNEYHNTLLDCHEQYGYPGCELVVVSLLVAEIVIIGLGLCCICLTPFLIMNLYERCKYGNVGDGYLFAS